MPTARPQIRTRPHELEAEHRQIESALFDVTHQVTDDRLVLAADRFCELTRTLLAHLEREEESLFPALDDWLVGDAGPSAPLRRDHDHIRNVVDDVAMALAVRDRGATLVGLGILAAVLGDHADREAEILYSARAMSPFER